jgi:hypothetical protein
MNAFRKLLKALSVAVACAIALAPSPLLACAACTGRTDSPLAVGMNWGILTLLGCVLSVLTCFVVFIVHVARRTPPDDGDMTTPGTSR